MTAYASADDVQARMPRELSEDERELCETLLDDAAVMIDALAPRADIHAKQLASCRMVIRALGDGGDVGVPLGASQGSVSALGYTQSWTMGSGGGAGELYIGKAERRLLGLGASVGSYSPVQELAT